MAVSDKLISLLTCLRGSENSEIQNSFLCCHSRRFLCRHPECFCRGSSVIHCI